MPSTTLTPAQTTDEALSAERTAAAQALAVQIGLYQSAEADLATANATIADLRQQILDLTKVTPVLMGGNFGKDPDESLYPDGIACRLYFRTETTIRNAAEARAYAKGSRLFVISTKTVASFKALVKTARPDCKYVWLINHEPEDDIFKDKILTIAEWHQRQVDCSKVAHDAGHRFANLIMTGTLTNKTDNRHPEDFAVGSDVADLTGVDIYPKNFPAYTVAQLVDLHLEWQRLNGGTPLLVGEYGVPGKTRPAESLKWTQQWRALVDVNPYEIVCAWSQGENVLTQPVADVLFARV